MSTGRQSLANIETTIQDLQARERDLQTELENANTRRTALLKERLDAFRALAEVRTRSAVADGVIDASDRLADHVASLLDARMKTVEGLRNRLHDAEKRREAELSAQADLTARIEAMETELDAIAVTVRENRAADPEYASAVEAADAARAVLARATAKTERARDDRDAKGRAYETDPLFMYLWKRRYGTSAYEGKGLVRWLDGKVADLVGYHGARANYAVLIEIPERLTEHTTRLAESAKTATAALEAIEARKIEAAAGPDRVSRLTQARRTHTAQGAALSKLAGEITDISSQLNRYAEGLDHAFRKAVDMSADFLADESIERLRRIARETATPSDDEIVERVARIDDEVDDLRDTSADKKQELERLFAKKTELMRVAAEYRRSRYDDPGSVFVPEGTGAVILEELLKGAIDAAEYWSRTRSSHRWRARPGDPFRRRKNDWPLGDNNSGWDFDWGSGGGRGGGRDDDFHTEGGF